MFFFFALRKESDKLDSHGFRILVIMFSNQSFRRLIAPVTRRRCLRILLQITVAGQLPVVEDRDQTLTKPSLTEPTTNGRAGYYRISKIASKLIAAKAVFLNVTGLVVAIDLKQLAEGAIDFGMENAAGCERASNVVDDPSVAYYAFQQSIWGAEIHPS